jgi:hypothetical protein
MINTLSDDDNASAREGEPRATMHTVAGKLTALGFDAREPDQAESRRLTIINPKCSRCELSVQDDGSVMCDYWPLHGADTGPTEITRLVMTMLGAGNVSSSEPDTGVTQGLTLKGAVGRALQAQGLDVSMNVYEDQDFYDVTVEIVAANPARPERGHVRVTDDGTVTWECECDDGASGDAEKIKEAIISVLAQDIADCRALAATR